MKVHERPGLCVKTEEHFLSEEEAWALYETIEASVPWRAKMTPGRRVSQNYGDEGFGYSVTIRGKTMERKVLPWSALRHLSEIRDRVAERIGERPTYCVIQRYPSGRVGINPHRDKEMKRGTTIAGLSLGAERILTMTPPRRLLQSEGSLTLSLPNGSLYALCPPTNDVWAHSIEKDGTTEPRISLTFRTA